MPNLLSNYLLDNTREDHSFSGWVLIMCLGNYQGSLCTRLLGSASCNVCTILSYLAHWQPVRQRPGQLVGYACSIYYGYIIGMIAETVGRGCFEFGKICIQRVWKSFIELLGRGKLFGTNVDVNKCTDMHFILKVYWYIKAWAAKCMCNPLHEYLTVCYMH